MRSVPVIEPCASVEQAGWLPLRRALWPEVPDAEHLAEMAKLIARPERFAQFVAVDSPGDAVGFVEASVRNDYVNGTESSPVGFVEGLYVTPRCRRRGIARALVDEVARWAALRGCHELASDTAVDNELSQKAHRALGFAETERVVYFRRSLTRADK